MLFYGIMKLVTIFFFIIKPAQFQETEITEIGKTRIQGYLVPLL